MKTQTGYTYIENGILVISPERKPEKPGHVGDQLAHEENMHQYIFDLGEFESNLIPVKNHYKIKDDKTAMAIHPMDKYSSIILGIVTPGQKVQYNEGEITKIL